MPHLKHAEKDSFDWPLADVAVVLDSRTERRLRARRDRAWRGGAGAASGEGRGGRSDRPAERRTNGEAGRARRARGRCAAAQERLQTADVRNAGRRAILAAASCVIASRAHSGKRRGVTMMTRRKTAMPEFSPARRRRCPRRRTCSGSSSRSTCRRREPKAAGR